MRRLEGDDDDEDVEQHNASKWACNGVNHAPTATFFKLRVPYRQVATSTHLHHHLHDERDDHNDEHQLPSSKEKDGERQRGQRASESV